MVYLQLNQHILENTEVHITLLESAHKRLEADYHKLESSNKRIKEDLYDRNTQFVNLLSQSGIKDGHGKVFIRLPCDIYQVSELQKHSGVTLDFENKTSYLNIIKESNNRLYFAISFPSHRQGNVTTHLINQTNIKDSIVFRNRELRCKPQFPFSLESKQSKPIPSYSVISTGLEGSLLQPPFLQGGVFILGIILTFS